MDFRSEEGISGTKTDHYWQFEAITSRSMLSKFLSHFIAEFVPKCKKKEQKERVEGTFDVTQRTR